MKCYVHFMNKGNTGFLQYHVMNPMIFFKFRIKTKLRREPTLFGGSFLVMYRDRPGNKPTAFVRAVN